MLELLDTAGQEEFTNFLPQWVMCSEAYVVGYEVISRKFL